uniref:SKP1-like protein n=1 Tax=Ananas comosus var. bracteatus TaxID=296719 RepID=A0A6V7PY75_ANACO|nr:unnamed protein product [Ananas comosus var. bracteatus]
MAGKMKMKLKSSEGKELEVDAAMVTGQSGLLRALIDIGITDVLLDDVATATLAKIVGYFMMHDAHDAALARADAGTPDAAAARAEAEQAILEYDRNFIDVDMDTLYCILMEMSLPLHMIYGMSPSNATLGSLPSRCEGLLELATKKVANLITDKSPEEIRALFRIENDFTPEEEEYIDRNIHGHIE